MKFVHQNGGEYVTCSECKKSLQSTSLHNHMQLFHSNEVPQHECKICTFQTIHYKNLKAHVKNIHPKRPVQEDS